MRRCTSFRARGAGPVGPLAVGLVTALLAAVIVGVLAVGARRQAPVVARAYVAHDDGRLLTNPFEIMLVQGDGQAYAALARDPTLARPLEFHTRAEAAYRAQRPLLGWLGWLLSFGRPGAVPGAFAVLEVVGVGLAGAALAALLRHRSGPAWAGVGVVILPGVFESLTWLGPEALGLGLAVAGLVALERRPARPYRAGALLTAAALARETLLVVPLGLVLARGRAALRRPGIVMLPFGAVAAWWVVLRCRVGAWPTAARGGRLSLPFAGLVDAAGRWAFPSGEWTYLLVAALLVVAVALARREDRPVAGVVVAAALLGVCMGPSVWGRWQDFTRPLLPLYALGFAGLPSPRAGVRPL